MVLCPHETRLSMHVNIHRGLEKITAIFTRELRVLRGKNCPHFFGIITINYFERRDEAVDCRRRETRCLKINQTGGKPPITFRQRVH